MWRIFNLCFAIILLGCGPKQWTPGRAPQVTQPQASFTISVRNNTSDSIEVNVVVDGLRLPSFVLQSHTQDSIPLANIPNTVDATSTQITSPFINYPYQNFFVTPGNNQVLVNFP